MALWLRLLGGASIEGDTGPLRGRAAHRRRLGLLALLAGARPGAVGRERLIGYLWPDTAGDAARHLLSESLYVLRKELGEDLFLTVGDQVALNPEAIRCDLIDFRQAVAEERWERAAEAYQGPLLDGFYVENAPDFERWVEVERDAAARDCARALEILGEQSERAGRMSDAVQWWSRLAVHDPYSSRAHLRLLEALAATGDRGRAVQIAAGHAARLREDLGVEPEPEILHLAERIRSAAPAGEARVPAPSAAPAEQWPASRPAAPAVVREPQPDGIAPDLDVLRMLGEGSMATVYLAREAALGRLVAVKVLAGQLARDETARLRFEREARSAARIQHPNVATVFRIGRTPAGLPFMVLPYVGGGSLKDRLAAAGPLPVDDVRRFLVQIASGLNAAHRLGIVHRDVRPPNILYDREADRVLLTDFGLAAILESGHETLMRLTRPGEPLGNPAYASPEQLRGETVTERADVYSLAVVAFQLLTGRLPFDAQSPVQMVAAHVRQEPKRVRELRGEVDAGLDDLLRRCLNKSPEQRPFASDLAALLQQG